MTSLTLDRNIFVREFLSACLGADEELLSSDLSLIQPVLEDLADRLFVGVQVGRVDEAVAGLQGGVEGRLQLRLVRGLCNVCLKVCPNFRFPSRLNGPECLKVKTRLATRACTYVRERGCICQQDGLRHCHTCAFEAHTLTCHVPRPSIGMAAPLARVTVSAMASVARSGRSAEERADLTRGRSHYDWGGL